jgi:outer membrane lipoprotein-sorting protein
MRGIKIYTLMTGLLIAGISSYAQTVDEIITKNTVAMGGADKLNGIKSQYMEGTMEVQGQTVPIKRWVKQDEGMRLEFNIMGTDNVQVVTRNNGWSLMPVMQQTEAQEMDPQMLKVMKTQLDLRGELYDYKAKGKKVELQGKDTVNGAPAYKLKIVAADGAVGTAYLDATSFLMVKATNTLAVQGQTVEMTTLLSDYRKTPEGLAYPAVTEQNPGGVKINITKIETNQTLADSLFAKPVNK